MFSNFVFGISWNLFYFLPLKLFLNYLSDGLDLNLHLPFGRFLVCFYYHLELFCQRSERFFLFLSFS